jgi:hypothetical protein
MNILIIAKTYHSGAMARAIQMRRVANALVEHGNYNVSLITEGENNAVENRGRLEIINCKRSVFKLFNKEKIAGVQLNDIVFLRKSTFVNDSIEIAKKIIVEKNIQLVLTVSTPFDAHLAGLNLKREFPSTTWVTFFSDMWPSCFLPKPYGDNFLSARKKTRMMKEVVEHCDGIITPSRYTLDIITTNFKTKAKLTAIPHCLSETSVDFEEPLRGFIVHSGLLSKERIAEPLIEAIKELAIENKDFKGFIHIGSYDRLFKKLIDKHRCKNIYLLGHMPEAMANRIQHLYEIGVIIEAPMKESSPFMPSKITDIIQLNKKLIVISPAKSFLADFARENEGIFSCPYSKEEIKKCIYDAIKSEKYINEGAINHFHPSTVSKQYEQFFNLF